jgi:glycosyltransferase involved in cell wall biosynthesis
MKICLVSAFPPSQGGLSEYGLHIAQELRNNPTLSLTVLADQLPAPQSELGGFEVLRCWSFNDPKSAVHILRAVRKLKPDVVWFNLLFSTFGANPLIAFSGLLTPVLARLAGRYTHVTLHHLMDTVDLKDAGVRFPRTYRLAGTVATKILLRSNSVSVLMPGYRKILNEKYGRDNIHLRSHGILAARPEYPDFSRRGNPEHRIFAFGKWGTYKRLELLIEAFQQVVQVQPDARLIVGGGNHPQAAGYIESMKENWAKDTRIQFTGYLDEAQLPDIFQSSSVAVMPYSSSTGCSGVAHLACAYGVPIICADLPDFREMSNGETIAIDFYKPGDAHDLARCLIEFLADPVKQEVMAVQNFSTALRMTMPMIVQKYLRHFELHQRVQALRYVSAVRKLPSWLPSKSSLLKLITRNSVGGMGVHRSGLPARGGAIMNSRLGEKLLLDSDIDGGGKAIVSVDPNDGDGIQAGSDNVIATGLTRDISPSAGNDNQSESEKGTEARSTPPAFIPAAYQSEAGDTGREEQPRIDRNTWLG